MKYARYKTLNRPTAEPVRLVNLTQPNAALSLREILERFTQGDNSVLSHIPVDDHTEEMTDEEFFKDDSFGVPVEPEDKLQAEEFIIQQKELSSSGVVNPKKETNEERKEVEGVSDSDN